MEQLHFRRYAFSLIEILDEKTTAAVISIHLELQPEDGLITLTASVTVSITVMLLFCSYILERMNEINQLLSWDLGEFWRVLSQLHSPISNLYAKPNFGSSVIQYIHCFILSLNKKISDHIHLKCQVFKYVHLLSVVQVLF